MGSCVLVVDDDPGVTRAVTRHLRDGYECTVVRTVREAVAALRGGRRWDGLIVDIGLPDGSGLDVVRAAQDLHPGAPVLVMTGDAAPECINAVFTLRARIVVKPVRRWMLLHLLQPCDGALASMLTCAQRHPERWEEAVLAFAVAKVDSGELADVSPAEWPDVLDDLAYELREALPEGIPRSRGRIPIH